MKMEKLMKLGKLEEKNVREVWPHEQHDFSAWLAREDNIQELGDVLGLSLVVEETEKFVGSFRCDILCKDQFTDKTVLIENQLEPCNPDHLGRIIIYASGVNASVVVWIVSKASADYVSAIRWLNDHTDDSLAFFLLEIHAFVIGDSLPAPKFVIVERPNDFSRSVKALAADNGEGGLKAYQNQFWLQFVEILEQRGTPFKKRSAPADMAYRVPLGSSHYRIDILLQRKRKNIEVCLWLIDDKRYYYKLFEHKDEIEEAVQCDIEWCELEKGKMSAIVAYVPGVWDFENQSNYPDLINKAIDVTIAMKNACLPYLQEGPEETEMGND